jgi:hypothetical protein
MTEGILRAHQRRLLTDLDQQPAARSQVSQLLGLVHRARATRFGCEHDFGRIRTEADFRRLVPLRTPRQIAEQYWLESYPRLQGATWPEHVSGWRTLPAPGPEWPNHLPVTPAADGAWRRALHVALGLVANLRPHAAFLDGRLLFLENDPAAPIRSPELTTLHQVPWLLRPYTLQRNPLDLREEDVAGPVTCVLGSTSAVLRLAQKVKEAVGRLTLEAHWPGLRAILYQGEPGGPTLDDLREVVGRGPLLLETVFRPDGLFAIEDPRHGCLRFLPGHRSYCEFLPLERTGDRVRPSGCRTDEIERLPLGEVKAGVPYELVVTSAVGLWACRVGLAVQFESCDPPLFRFVALPRDAEQPLPEPALRSDPAQVTLPPRIAHPRIVGIPAALPEKFVHNPWSVSADRG